MGDIYALKESILQLTVPELTELVNAVGRENWTLYGQIAAQFVPDTGTFAVELIEVGLNKLTVIKTIRQHTNADLKAAKEFTDRVPVIVGESTRRNCEAFVLDLQSCGAQARVKPVEVKHG